MALTLWRKTEPFGFMTDFEREIDRWFGDDWFDIDSMAGRSFGDIMGSSRAPAVDVEEKNGKYILRADLPGVKKHDIHVELKDGYLTLSGERTMENEEKKKNYRRIERAYGRFERSFRVPESVKEKDIHASFKNGILELTVPVKEGIKHKAIDVKVE
jgi:HSP20 family protein